MKTMRRLTTWTKSRKKEEKNKIVIKLKINFSRKRSKKIKKNPNSKVPYKSKKWIQNKKDKQRKQVEIIKNRRSFYLFI
jgi:hypothetical protein